MHVSTNPPAPASYVAVGRGWGGVAFGADILWVDML